MAETLVLCGVAAQWEHQTYRHAPAVAGDNGNVVFEQCFEQSLRDGYLLVVEYHYAEVFDGSCHNGFLTDDVGYIRTFFYGGQLDDYLCVA